MKKVIRTKRGIYNGVRVRSKQVLTVPDTDAEKMVSGNVAVYAKGEAPVKKPVIKSKKKE